MTSNRRILHVAFSKLMDRRFPDLPRLKIDAGALNHMEKIVIGRSSTLGGAPLWCSLGGADRDDRHLSWWRPERRTIRRNGTLNLTASKVLSAIPELVGQYPRPVG